MLLKSVVVPCGYSCIGFVAGAGGGATRGRYVVSISPSATHGLNLWVGQPGVQTHKTDEERKEEREMTSETSLGAVLN